MPPRYPFDQILLKSHQHYRSYKLSPMKHPFFSQLLIQKSCCSMEPAMAAAFNVNSFLSY
ncbi:hypothetical protein NC652_007212 [Populus alba x Populus x berolinensis]|nr:hypothetical protein NC652_007212 [Populus alba x Populus x berolinensis]